MGQVAIKTTMRAIDSYMNKAMGTENVVYCIYADTDSVVGDSLVWVNGKQIPISDLFDQIPDDAIVNRDEFDLVKTCSTEILTKTYLEDGTVVDRPIKHVMKHKVKKRLFKLTVGGKSVTITEDHGVIVRRNGKLETVTPTEMLPTDMVISLNIQTQIPKEITKNETMSDMR